MAGQGINKAPVGLLDFLGIKNFGQYPVSLGQVLVPTFELLQWYLAEYGESIAASAAYAVNGYQAFFTVPSNETWVCVAAGMNSQAVLGAGQVMHGVVATTRGPNPGVQVPLATTGVRAATGAVAYSGFEGLVFLPPGATIGVQGIELAGGPITLTVSAVVVKCGR